MKVLRYAAVGGTATLVDFSIFAVFAKFLGFNYFWVGAAGFILGTMLNYLLCVRFVFESGARFTASKELTWVFLVSLVGLSAHQALLYIGIGLLGWDMLLTKVLATGAVFLWNFGSRSWFIFKPARNREPDRDTT